jgi:hypothetical protein
MTGTINTTPCPECKLIEKLYIDVQFVSSELGTFSLAGAQIKTSGKMLPILKCHNCDFSLMGDFDGDRHVVFTPPDEMSP